MKEPIPRFPSCGFHTLNLVSVAPLPDSEPGDYYYWGSALDMNHLCLADELMSNWTSVNYFMPSAMVQGLSYTVSQERVDQCFVGSIPLGKTHGFQQKYAAAKASVLLAPPINQAMASRLWPASSRFGRLTHEDPETLIFSQLVTRSAMFLLKRSAHPALRRVALNVVAAVDDWYYRTGQGDTAQRLFEDLVSYDAATGWLPRTILKSVAVKYLTRTAWNGPLADSALQRALDSVLPNQLCTVVPPDLCDTVSGPVLGDYVGSVDALLEEYRAVFNMMEYPSCLFTNSSRSWYPAVRGHLLSWPLSRVLSDSERVIGRAMHSPANGMRTAFVALLFAEAFAQQLDQSRFHRADLILRFWNIVDESVEAVSAPSLDPETLISRFCVDVPSNLAACKEDWLAEVDAMSLATLMRSDAVSYVPALDILPGYYTAKVLGRGSLPEDLPRAVVCRNHPELYDLFTRVNRPAVCLAHKYGSTARGDHQFLSIGELWKNKRTMVTVLSDLYGAGVASPSSLFLAPPQVGFHPITGVNNE